MPLYETVLIARNDVTQQQVEAIADTIRLTQKYARRQMSWFRRDTRINWLDYRDASLTEQAIELVEAHLTAGKNQAAGQTED